MLFHSFAFAIFLPIVCLIYFIIPDRWKKYHLLLASYYFYMSYNPVYLLLMFFSTITTFFCGIFLDRFQKNSHRKITLVVVLLSNLGLLFLFKYYGFFTDSLIGFLATLGISAQFPSFSLILPIGISFYTFQVIGYIIDIYRRKVPAENNFAFYALFVSFFPQVVAGPIERSTTLLPQLAKAHAFDYQRVTMGLKIMAIGFFKKIVIADSLVNSVNGVFSSVYTNTAPAYIIAAVFFSIQIYCDFSGYTDIATGCAKIFGIDLMKNFDRPYFASSIGQFWRSWHISLTSWFRDYVYIPLGGNRVSQPRWCFNIVLTYLLSGLWHGANWTFVAWGALHSFYQLMEKFCHPFSSRLVKMIGLDKLPQLYLFLQISFTFTLVCIARVFFCANNMEEALYMYSSIITNLPAMLNFSTLNSLLEASTLSPKDLKTGGIMFLTITAFELFDRKYSFWPAVGKLPLPLRLLIYAAIIYLIFLFTGNKPNQFIYFQF